MSHTADFKVVGMTCSHCGASVTEEVKAIESVTDVSVDLDSGRLSVTSEPAVSDAAVRAAVEDAGYQLA